MKTTVLKKLTSTTEELDHQLELLKSYDDAINSKKHNAFIELAIKRQYSDSSHRVFVLQVQQSLLRGLLTESKREESSG